MPIHIVTQGDSPYSIASMYGISTSRLIYDNQLTLEEPLVPGQALLILIPSVVHQIQTGETLFSIAADYQTSIKSLLRNNPYLLLRPTLDPGTSIVIRYPDERIREALVGGYAYPFIAPALLTETLLYLSDLFIFSYGFTLEGTLVAIDDDALLAAAKAEDVAPILTLTPFDATGVFNSYLVHVLVGDIAIQDRLIGELIQVMERKGYAGIDIDFEYIERQDREGYSAFVARVTERMNPLGFRTSVALAPKESADWPGVLYEGIDYPALGAAANQVLLMTYEWGYTYGPPMAVAPLNKVRQILDYAVTEIPREKINMGIPNYAYDWLLPYERGVTKAENISNVEAVRRAARYGSTIRFDETAQSPYYEYSIDGNAHIVWFEDVRSIQAKLSLIPEYNILGAGYWSLMKPFRANWLLLDSMLEITPG